MKILEFDVLPSTNDYVKSHAAEGDMVVTARRQTAGRGTKGRGFDSGMGGLYLSKLTHYEKFPAANVFKIMLDSSVAVCRTLEDFGLAPAVKWPNDVWLEGKKVCGILIENVFRGPRLVSSVVGIGLNVCNRLSAELAPIAVTMSEVKGETLSVDAVRERLIFHLNGHYSLEEYKKYIFFFGEKILLRQGKDEREVTALDVDGSGRLVVAENGERYAVSAGEVTLRLQGQRRRNA